MYDYLRSVLSPLNPRIQPKLCSVQEGKKKTKPEKDATSQRIPTKKRKSNNYNQNPRPPLNKQTRTIINTMSSEDWRRIDIDALEPENHLTKEELLPTDIPPTSIDQIQSVASQIRSSLSSGQFQLALILGLDNVPYIADEQTKELHAKTIFEVLCSIRNNNNINDLTGFVKGLNKEQQDVLIKYLYKSMSSGYGQKQGGLLLNWFEKLSKLPVLAQFPVI